MISSSSKVVHAAAAAVSPLLSNLLPSLEDESESISLLRSYRGPVRAYLRPPPPTTSPPAARTQSSRRSSDSGRSPHSLSSAGSSAPQLGRGSLVHALPWCSTYLTESARERTSVSACVFCCCCCCCCCFFYFFPLIILTSTLHSGSSGGGGGDGGGGRYSSSGKRITSVS